MPEEPALLEASLTPGVYGLPIVTEGIWRPGDDRPPLVVNTGLVVYGTLDDLEALARAVLREVAAIRRREG